YHVVILLCLTGFYPFFTWFLSLFTCFAIYEKTDDGLLFQVEPHFRIPRTHERFYGIMLELLERKRVRVPETNEVIIQQLDGPLTQYLPSNSRIVGLSYNAEKVMDINDYLSTMADDVTPIFVMGAMVRGKVNKAGTDNYISRSYTCYSSEMYNVFAADQGKPWFLVAVSNYPLSAAYSTALVFIALANKWELH
ncbi:hypothetical protein QUC31_002377, partial [Theobroma cacao]